MTADTDTPATTEQSSGRRYLIGAGLTVVLFATFTGYTLGSNSPASSARFASLVTVPVTRWSLALYGTILSGLVVVTLFGLVTLASRYDDDSVN